MEDLLKRLLGDLSTGRLEHRDLVKLTACCAALTESHLVRSRPACWSVCVSVCQSVLPNLTMGYGDLDKLTACCAALPESHLVRFCPVTSSLCVLMVL